jgi:hypothetical protein
MRSLPFQIATLLVVVSVRVKPVAPIFMALIFMAVRLNDTTVHMC